MTCIVGLEADNKVWIAGDSGSSNGVDILSTRLRKVFKKGPFLIGYTSSFRMGQLLQYSLEVENQKESQTDLEYMATTFINSVRSCLNDGGFGINENGQESGGVFLIGYRGILYRVDDDYQVNTFHGNFTSVGSGYRYAVGSLYSSKHLPSKKRLKLALKAAGAFDQAVCGPYYVECLKD